MEKISIVYTTVSSRDTADELAADAVIKGLASCANIFEHVTSVYQWQGVLEKSQEVAIVFKVLWGKKDSLVAWLQKSHPYETPAILWADANTTEDFFNYMSQ